MADLSVVGWRAWCDDGAGGIIRFSSRATAWGDVRASSIIHIMLYFGDGLRRIMANEDFYWHESTGLLASHWHQSMTRPTGDGLVIQDGKLVADGVYSTSGTEAMDDMREP